MSWSPTPPASFAPLDGRNGVPGDAGALTTLARRYEDTAAEIEAQAANLRRLTSQARGGWKGEAGEKFVERAGDLSERIVKARGRYEAAARALRQFAEDLGEVQTRAYGAVHRAQEAQADRRTLEANRPARAAATATPEEATAAAADLRDHQHAVEEAATRLSTARRDYDRAAGDYERAARSAAATLRDARGREELRDGWWDRNAGWITTALKWIAVAVFVIAIAALIIAFAAPTLVIAGTAISVVGALNAAGAALTVVMLGAHIGLAATDNGDWDDVVWDLVGLATFGLGFGVGAIARNVGGAASRIGQAIAATRGGRAAFAARGLPGRLFDLGRRVPFARTALSLSSRMRNAFRAADDAADAARTTVATLTGSPTAVTSRVLAFADRDLAELATLVSRIDAAVPGSIRIDAIQKVTTASAVTWGWVVQGGQLVKSGADVVNDFVVEPSQEARDTARRAETVEQWSMPLCQVR
ncbi:WXG100 family type VII secretion target [Geodermatophilus sp. SYSU D01105]